MENTWWLSKAKEIQSYADSNAMQKFYDEIKATYGPTHHSVHPVRSKDGNTLTKDQQGILARWAEHLSDLLNHICSTDSTFVDLLPQLPTTSDLDQPPSFHEVHKAVKGLRNNIAAGPDGISAEILKYGGDLLLHRLHRIICAAWTSGKLPQQWKDATIVTIYKCKGDKSVCGNSRGISLLSVAGKVLARVTLRRLLTQVAETVRPELQCGFRRGRSTIDMIFIARLLQEKCCEQHRNLFLAFIDLTKAFDTVNRDVLWKVLSKFGCPPHFLTILREFHDGMQARVVIGGQESDPFEVLAGVKQGCVLAPAIFNLFLVAVTLVFRTGLSTDEAYHLNTVSL